MNRSLRFHSCIRLTLALFAALFSLALSPSEVPFIASPMEPYLNGAFTARPPGNGLNFTLEDPLPGQTFYGPIRIIPFAGTDDLLVLGKKGEVWRINLEDQAAESVLDFKDRSFSKGDAGAVGIALHPRFSATDATANEKVVFIYYRYKPDPELWDERGYNRLSKFAWDDDLQQFDGDSEEILIQQYDRSTWHAGGDLFFGEDGFLYFGVGDEGQEEFINDSNQKLNVGLFNGVFRIDVDNNPERSHPIIRQPLPNAEPPNQWPPTYSQGYSIPNDNPWLSPDGEQLEEFYALGVRSPFTLRPDPATGKIWVADVGATEVEEISVVEKGSNLQWPFQEGYLGNPLYDRPATIIGEEMPPVLTYDREFGRSITGGSVYRGNKFYDLNGLYLFSDFISNRLMAVDAETTPGSPDAQLITLIDDMRNEAVDIPSGAGVTGIYPQANGDVLITMIGSRMDAIPGKIFRLRQQGSVPEPAERLSQLGVFTDLASLTVAPGIIPYRTNAPLWSDRALKKRWIALPNDGNFDSNDEKIDFARFEPWQFPPGTVFIKHFDLPLTTDPNGPVRRLETRFFIVGPERSYGLSYHWNAEGTDAFLAGEASSLEVEITDAETGAPAFTQNWEFPGRAQCLSCHTANAGSVLGFNTHQLNGDYHYPETPATPINQLTYLSQLGVFQQSLPPTDQLPRAHALEDAAAGLEIRVRSYLDANCASCHRPGGVPTLGMDLRFNTELPFTNMVNVTATSHNSAPGRLIVQPGDHQSSELWVRDAQLDGTAMPPLAKNILDEPYLGYLAEWIDGLSEDAGVNQDNRVYPNPVDNVVSLRLSDNWAGPFALQLFNVSGQALHTTEFSEHHHQLELGFLPPGVYLLVIRGNGESLTQRVIKR